MLILLRSLHGLLHFPMKNMKNLPLQQNGLEESYQLAVKHIEHFIFSIRHYKNSLKKLNDGGQVASTEGQTFR